MQLHKSIWCIVMSIVISVSLAIPSFANMSDASSTNHTENLRVSKEKALQTARTLTDIPASFFVEDIKLKQIEESHHLQKEVWQILFASKNNEQILVLIDSHTNTIKSYHKNVSTSQDTQAYPPKVNLQQAKQIAMQWLIKIKFPYLNQLYEEEITQPFSHIPLNPKFTYAFQFFRKVEGVPVIQQGVQVLVSNTGKVVKYQSIWNDNMAFESAKPKITLEQAMTQLNQRMPIVHMFKVPDYELGAKIPYVATTSKTFMVDAQTGQFLNSIGDPLATMPRKPLTEKPLASKTTKLKLLSRNQIIEKVKTTLNIPAAFHLDSMQKIQTADKLPQTEWLIQWVSDTNDGKPAELGTSKVITVKYREFNDQIMLYEVEGMPVLGGIDSAPVPFEKAKQTSIEFVKKQLPHLTHQLVDGLEEASYEQQLRNQVASSWSFSFNRMVHGIISTADHIQVYINKLTGHVERYEVKLKPQTLPQVKPKLIDPQVVREKLASRYEAQLIYFISEQQASSIDQTDGAINAKMQAKLMYRYIDKLREQPLFLDGVDGVWRKASTGVSVNIEKEIATDIQGHWAQSDMELMMYHDVFRKQGSLVFPEQAMTMKEILKMLIIIIHRSEGFEAFWNARSVDSKTLDDEGYEPYILEAINLGLIGSRQDLNINEKVLRIQFAELLVKALGFHKLASYQHVFHQGIKDIIRTEQVGYAAIVSGLGIMELDQGEFKPDAEITRAQASQTIVRFLQKSEEMNSAKK